MMRDLALESEEQCQRLMSNPSMSRPTMPENLGCRNEAKLMTRTIQPWVYCRWHGSWSNRVTTKRRGPAPLVYAHTLHHALDSYGGCSAARSALSHHRNCIAHDPTGSMFGSGYQAPAPRSKTQPPRSSFFSDVAFDLLVL